MNDQIQWIQRHIWLAGLDLRTEREQATQEGRDLSSVTGEFDRLLAVKEKAAAWYENAGKLMDRVQELPCRPGEPSDLAGIHAARPKPVTLQPWRGSRAKFLERLHGGWLGRICGCMLGKPVEGWHRGQIRLYGEVTDNWPLRDYFRSTTPREAKRIGKLTHRPDCLRGNICCMPEDDDINYTTIGFAVVKKHGANFTQQDVASFWCDNVPLLHTCTAERVAYRNFANCIVPPASATYRNPYREWIGAQIRADYFGYANPGNPARAAEWAWRDASISHVKNGIYGEMWVAAMLAAAYVETDWLQIIRAGLAQIPAESRLTADIEKIIATKSYDEAVELVRTQWTETNWHHWCHTNSNAQIVAIGLLWGEDDYEKTITRAVMPGFDTDCNGATCGSLWGIKHGVTALPKKWTRPIRNLVHTGVAGYHEAKISDLAEEMADVAIKNRA